MAYEENENIAKTIFDQAKDPIVLHTNEDKSFQRIAVPEGWSVEDHDDERMLAQPRRKKACVTLLDAEGMIDYVKRHGSLTTSTLWCQADYGNSKVRLQAIINDNGENPDDSAWRDHIAVYDPRFSEEWKRWTSNSSKPFSQADFALFLEDNLQDIATVEGMPTGAEILEMALEFEAKQDMRFKSLIRLQSGGVQMQFVQDDDAQTIEKMKVFDRFQIGIPVFWNGDAYRIDARLRYRAREGKLTFWYDLIRHDKALEDATKTIIQIVKEKTGTPFFFGDPFRN